MVTIRRVVYEEKQLVLQDWPAKRSAEDGLRERLAGNSGNLFAQVLASRL